LDIRENFNDVLRFQLLPGAGLWANIGQENSESNMPPKTLDEMRERPQTVNYQRIDFDKVKVEVYLVERAYHNSKDTYLLTSIIIDDINNKEGHSYIRPHGLYYEYLKEKGEKILNIKPNDFPKIPVETELEAKEVFIFSLSRLAVAYLIVIASGSRIAFCYSWQVDNLQSVSVNENFDLMMIVILDGFAL